MPQDDKALLQRLNAHEVEFVIIGGVCGVLHGVSLVTLDLDICCRFTVQNLRRLETAIKGLSPYHRLTTTKVPLEMTDEFCARIKNLYLQTDLGVLDCLSEVAGLGNYDAVVERSMIHRMSFGDIRILTLEALIVAKEATGRDRDLAAVKQLRGIQERDEHRKDLN